MPYRDLVKMIVIALAVLLSYAVFALVADGLRPFRMPRVPVRRRHWRLGRAAGTATAVLALPVALLKWFSGSWSLALLILVFTLPVAIWIILRGRDRFRRSDQWAGENDDDERDADLVNERSERAGAGVIRALAGTESPVARTAGTDGGLQALPNSTPRLKRGHARSSRR